MQPLAMDTMDNDADGKGTCTQVPRIIYYDIILIFI